MLYAFTSGAGNNGRAFAGLNANTPWYNITLGLTMLAGRFLMIIPALGIAGGMVGKKVVPAGPGTFPTNGPLFTGLLVSVVLIVGALTFFPALSPGPHRRALPRRRRKELSRIMAATTTRAVALRSDHPPPGGQESFSKLSPRRWPRTP